ncbi:hypothetical protein D1006_39205 [Burkholderia stabilis]|uniref:Uncharacterized protein n=1 Tax=Burkholderia stabilis TaxID=95485 RepID=A0A4V1PQK4_9BURK|nr:hypothetical protein D1006_39205 [Burkholderia stabilis]
MFGACMRIEFALSSIDRLICKCFNDRLCQIGFAGETEDLWTKFRSVKFRIVIFGRCVLP